jgi:3-deoxy-D-manno-octulosonic-acid transferase
MHPILFLIYNGIFIPIFSFLIRLAAFFNRKVAAGLLGRRGIFQHLAEQCAGMPADEPRIWIHIASLGEFEQAKPIVSALRSRIPRARIALSFFSPSGFVPAQKYKNADLITYLPLDSWRQTGTFLNILKPSLHLIIRHDIWPNMQWQLQRRGIPSLLVDASLTPQRFRSISMLRVFIRPVYATFAEVLVTAAENIRYFEWIYPWPSRISTCGDTRYDQVNQRALETGKIEFLKESKRFSRENCMVVGSSWPSDEKIIMPALCAALQSHPDFRLIIAPHETTEEHLAGIETQLAADGISWVRLADFSSQGAPFQVLLIDRIGLLANLYALGGLVFVGGGFGPGIHNVLEPAAHGNAVCFGPRYINSLEAVELIHRGGGIPLNSTEEMRELLTRFLEEGQTIRKSGDQARALVQENLGASERVVDAILRHLPGENEVRHG